MWVLVHWWLSGMRSLPGGFVVGLYNFLWQLDLFEETLGRRVVEAVVQTTSKGPRGWSRLDFLVTF